MSEVKGANKTLFDAKTIISPGLFDGRVKCMVDTFEASTLAEESTIKMGAKLPKGAVILGGILAYDVIGGSVTLSVGDAEEPARYISGQNASAAGVTEFDEVDGIGYTLTALDTQILITIGGSGTADNTIKVIVFYTND